MIFQVQSRRLKIARYTLFSTAAEFRTSLEGHWWEEEITGVKAAPHAPAASAAVRRISSIAQVIYINAQTLQLWQTWVPAFSSDAD